MEGALPRPGHAWYSRAPRGLGNEAEAGSPLHEALQQAVQHVAAVPHEADVLRRAVDTLPIQDGALEHVAELLPGAEEVRAHEVHHAPVLDEVVLQRVPGQHYPTARANALQGLRGAGLAVFDAVSLVADDHIRARAAQGLLKLWGGKRIRSQRVTGPALSQQHEK